MCYIARKICLFWLKVPRFLELNPFPSNFPSSVMSTLLSPPPNTQFLLTTCGKFGTLTKRIGMQILSLSFMKRKMTTQQICRHCSSSTIFKTDVYFSGVHCAQINKSLKLPLGLKFPEVKLEWK